MLMPKKVKFRKQQKGKRRGKAWRGSRCLSANTG
jgi:large subunit ribosomal protein L16